jgi:hypothetical protein
MKNTVIAVLALLLVGAGAYAVLHKPTSSAPDATPQTTTISFALLDTTGEGTGRARGCDTISVVTRTIPATTTPLTAALQALFAEPEGAQPSSHYNFIARTRSTLHFDHVTVSNNTARIYLTGSLSGLAGVCDDPRAAIQLEETAFRYPAIAKVEFYLNGQKTTLTPSQQ